MSKVIHWRGSTSDLATDICGYLKREQVEELVRDLQYILDHVPSKFGVRAWLQVGVKFAWVEDERIRYRAEVTELREFEAVARDQNGCEYRLSREDIHSSSFIRL